MRAAGLEGPAGGIFHFAGPSPNGGWRDRGVRVGGGREAVATVLRPAFEEVGAPPPPPPELWPVHNYMV